MQATPASGSSNLQVLQFSTLFCLIRLSPIKIIPTLDFADKGVFSGQNNWLRSSASSLERKSLCSIFD
jgi:hypothetical protein